METYPAPPSKPEPGTIAWAVDWITESAGGLAAWVARNAAAEPAITALLGLLAILVLWRLARSIARTPRRPSAATTATGAPRPSCRWKRDKQRHRQARFTRWVCAECGAEGYSSDNRPPTECKRTLRAHQL